MSVPAIKTILELDLVSYGDIARTLEENLDVQAVKSLQAQIQSFIDAGLSDVELRREDVVFATAGDSALLVFDDAERMHRFAASVSRATSDHNRSKSVSSAQRWFRMGCATGEVLLDRSKREVVGGAVTRAVRLESASDQGALLVDAPTFAVLPAALQSEYGPELIVTGKREERFVARRRSLVEEQNHTPPRSTLSREPNPLLDVWDTLDANLQDAFALAYNKKRRERADRPTRISTHDLFQALERISDTALQQLLGNLPHDAMPEASPLVLTNERRLLEDDPLLSDCVEESLRTLTGASDPALRVAPVDIFVDIAKHGHGPSVDRLRAHDVGPAEIDSRLASLGIRVFEPRGS